MTAETASKGVKVKRGAGIARKSPPPPPFPFQTIQHRDPLTGRYAKKPEVKDAGAGARPRVKVRGRPPEAADFRVMRMRLDYDDGSSKIIRVKVSSQTMRQARLSGEISVSVLRDFEAEQSREMLAEVNPLRAREYELEEMHKAHNSDKGRRGAISRKRNAEARAKDEARGIRVRTPKRK